MLERLEGPVLKDNNDTIVKKGKKEKKIKIIKNDVALMRWHFVCQGITQRKGTNNNYYVET